LIRAVPHLLLGFAVAVSGCSKPKAPEKPRSTLVKPKAQTTSASYLELLPKKAGSLPTTLGAVNFQSDAKAAAKLPAALQTGKYRPIKDLKAVTMKIVLHADTQMLRSVRLNLPTGAREALTAHWGDPIEGQADGRRRALFWFDTSARVQVILEQREEGDQLTFWPYYRLVDTLKHSGQPASPSLADWLGKTQAEGETAFPRRMQRRARPGFVAWLPPLQYRTRPLSVRFTLEGDRIEALSFKIPTAGNPGMAARVEEIIQQGWKVKARETEAGKRWVRDGKQIRIHQEQPGRLRPPAPIIRVTLEASPTP